MFGVTFERLLIEYPSIGSVVRKALPLRPGGRPLPRIDHSGQSIYSLTALPIDYGVGAVGITTTRNGFAKHLCVPDDSIIYVGKVIQSTATAWMREQKGLSNTTPVSKEEALEYVRKINPPKDFDLLIDDACTSRVVQAIEKNLYLPIILDTKLLWLLLLMGKDCPILLAQSLPRNLAQITIGFTCATNVANDRHTKRDKSPGYKPTSDDLALAAAQRRERYEGDQRAFKKQYRVSYTPKTIFQGLNMVVDTTYLTPEQQVEKITQYLIRRYGSNPTAMQTLGLLPSK